MTVSPTVAVVILVWPSNKLAVLDYPISSMNDTLLFCISLYHTKMLIQKLQKWWIENPSLLTCGKWVQNSTNWIVFTYIRSIWILQPNIFKVIGFITSIMHILASIILKYNYITINHTTLFWLFYWYKINTSQNRLRMNTTWILTNLLKS